MRWLATVLAITLVAHLGCTTSGERANIPPGGRPSPESVEAGLWMYMDKVESQVRTSGRVVTDPTLNQYVRGIICRIVSEYCADIRFYIVQTPHFNASMAPNGYMEIWTGLLLRAENEAQLAYVIAHEVGHYLRRHSLQRWLDVRATTDFLVFFQVASSAAGVGYAGELGELVALGYLFKFSRDQEREADGVGFDLMVAANYDPRQAARVWTALLDEQEASDDPESFIFFASHPATEERIENLQARALRLAEKSETPQQVGREAYVSVTHPFRGQWLRDELRKRKYAETQVILKRLLKAGDNVGELRFFQGELYRLRGEDGDLARAITSYQQALAAGGAPPTTHRSLGMVYWRIEERIKAQLAFQAYLNQAPNAPDREMVESYLQKMH